MNRKRPLSSINLYTQPNIVKSQYQAQQQHQIPDINYSPINAPDNNNEFQIQEFQEILNNAVEEQTVGQAQNTFVDVIQNLCKQANQLLKKNQLTDCVMLLHIICDWTNIKNKNLTNFFVHQGQALEAQNNNFKKLLRCPVDQINQITNILSQLLIKCNYIQLAEELLQKSLKSIQAADQGQIGHLGVTFLNLSTLKLIQQDFLSSSEFARNAIMQVQQEIIEYQRRQLMDNQDLNYKIEELGDILCKSLINLGQSQEKIGLFNESHLSYHNALINANKYLPSILIEQYRQIYQQYMCRMTENIQRENMIPSKNQIKLKQKFRISSVTRQNKIKLVYSKQNAYQPETIFSHKISRKSSSNKKRLNSQNIDDLEYDSSNNFTKTTSQNNNVNPFNFSHSMAFLNKPPLLKTQEIKQKYQDKIQINLQPKHAFYKSSTLQTSGPLCQSQQQLEDDNQFVKMIENIFKNRQLSLQNKIQLILENQIEEVHFQSTKNFVQVQLYLIPTKKIIYLKIKNEQIDTQHVFHLLDIWQFIEEDQDLLQSLAFNLITCVKLNKNSLFFVKRNIYIEEYELTFFISIKNQCESKILQTKIENKFIQRNQEKEFQNKETLQSPTLNGNNTFNKIKQNIKSQYKDNIQSRQMHLKSQEESINKGKGNIKNQQLYQNNQKNQTQPQVQVEENDYDQTLDDELQDFQFSPLVCMEFQQVNCQPLVQPADNQSDSLNLNEVNQQLEQIQAEHQKKKKLQIKKQADEYKITVKNSDLNENREFY